MKKRILFVCTGNICRSPTAEAVTRSMIERQGLTDLLEVDSAGTHDYHVGEMPDKRSMAAAIRRGYDLSALRARRVGIADFQYFDLVLGMDAGHVSLLRDISPAACRSKIGLFMRFARRFGQQDVPDPYYGDGSARLL